MKKPLFMALLAFTLPVASQTITVGLAISQGGTPLGILTLELDHLNAPMATANFIGLASGEFPWLDSTTGLVQTNTPYYNGIKIHRTDKGFVSQFGSQKGDGSDGPGYTFPDEPDLGALAHDSAYVLSMANSGPNTNGSQVFITAAPTPFLDTKHIVFGNVASGSHALADTINCVPVVDADGPDDIPGNGDDDNRPATEVIITSVTVNYNGVSFDPKVQGLPVVSAPLVTSFPNPASTEIHFAQPPGSVAGVSASSDASSWNEIATRYADATEPALDSFPLLGGSAGNATHFFSPSLVTYGPNALFPADLNDRTLVTFTNADPSNPIIFTFNSTGSGGTWNYTTSSGSFTQLLFKPDGFGARIVLQASGLTVAGTPLGYLDFQRLGFDSSSPTSLTGRQKGIGAQSSLHFQFGIGLRDLIGIFSLSR